MKELPIFMSYRQEDGIELARWIYTSIHGRTIFAPDGSIDTPHTIAVYFDQSALPVDEWEKSLRFELMRARILLVICSPGAAREFTNDAFYDEIRWWVGNRDSVSPILITPAGQRWIPEPIHERWPQAQTIDVRLRAQNDHELLKDQSILDAAIERILAGIAMRMRGLGEQNHGNGGGGELMNIPGLYTWEKDKHFRYINCNDNYARAAGFDSPQAMIGKSDDDMPWRTLADIFRQGDQGVLDAKSPARTHVQETEIMADRVADILVTENQLLSKEGKCVGVTGYFLDITGKQLVPATLGDQPRYVFNLGPQFGDQTFSSVEASVFKGILRKFESEQIASVIGISKAEVESTIKNIMLKLQCTTIGDVVATAIRAGLPLSLFGPD